MKLCKLIQCEFIKNYSLKKIFIIMLVLFLTCLALIKIESISSSFNFYSDPLSISEFNIGYEKAKSELQKNNNLANEGILEIFNKMEIPYNKAYSYVEDGVDQVWQKEAIDTLRLDISDLVVLVQLRDNYQDDFFKDWLEKNDDLYYYNFYSDIFNNYTSSISKYIDYSLDDINKQINQISKRVDLKTSSLVENAYYIYVESSCNIDSNNLDKDLVNALKTRCEIIIKNKIENENDYRVVNIEQYITLFNAEEIYATPSESEYDPNDSIFHDYRIEKKYNDRMLDIYTKNRYILDYAIKNDMKHDIVFSNDYVNRTYSSSKSYMNMGLHLGVVIIFVLAITSSGIVSKEHDKGTIKMLLTKPVKRSYVLLSKILYLIINVYLLWLLASLILFFLSGLISGFGDLFMPKLLVVGESVVETNYLLWYLKEMFICGLPVCCFVVFLFSLSTISLHTSLTASIISILSIFSLFVWNLISNFGMTFLSFLLYTPIPYLNYWFVRSHYNFYDMSIVRTNLSDSYGIIISIVIAVLSYMISVYIYSKRDIKV